MKFFKCHGPIKCQTEWQLSTPLTVFYSKGKGDGTSVSSMGLIKLGILPAYAHSLLRSRWIVFDVISNDFCASFCCLCVSWDLFLCTSLFFSVKSPFKWRYKCCLSGGKGRHKLDRPPDYIVYEAAVLRVATRFFMFPSPEKKWQKYLEISSFFGFWLVSTNCIRVRLATFRREIASKCVFTWLSQ